MTGSRRFEKVPVLSREEALATLHDGDDAAKMVAMLSLALNDPDAVFVQDRCMELLTDSDPEIRGTAALCLGHVARIHRQIDRIRVIPALQRLASDPVIGW